MAQIANLIDGRLSSAKAVLFTVPQCQNFFIRSIILINNDESNNVNVELWIDRGAGSRRIIPKYSIAAGRDAQEQPFIPLRPGDKIQGQASVADKVDFLIGYFMSIGG